MTADSSPNNFKIKPLEHFKKELVKLKRSEGCFQRLNYFWNALLYAKYSIRNCVLCTECSSYAHIRIRVEHFRACFRPSGNFMPKSKKWKMKVTDQEIIIWRFGAILVCGPQCSHVYCGLRTTDRMFLAVSYPAILKHACLMPCCFSVQTPSVWLLLKPNNVLANVIVVWYLLVVVNVRWVESAFQSGCIVAPK